MARYVSFKCPGTCLVKHKNKFDSAKIVGLEKSEYVIRCEGCALETTKEIPAIRQKSLRYPHFNDSIGEVVESRDHEDHMAKNMGLEKV